MCYWIIFHWVIFLIQDDIVCVPQAKKDIQPQKLRECLMDLAKNRLEHQTLDWVFCIDSRKRSVWQSFLFHLLYPYNMTWYCMIVDQCCDSVNFKFSEIYLGKNESRKCWNCNFLVCIFSSFGLWWSEFIKWVLSVTFIHFVSFVRNIGMQTLILNGLADFTLIYFHLFLLKPKAWFFCT